MRVLMYGWEFPPQNNGGLGTACEGIVNGLIEHGLKINLVLPKNQPLQSDSLVIHRPSDNFQKFQIKSPLAPYRTNLQGNPEAAHEEENYNDLFNEVSKFTAQAAKLAKKIPHDIIHAHDWMTYPAAIEAKKTSKKPFIAHLHALEHDRTGDQPHPLIAEIEKIGLQNADKIIAVSQLTKNRIIKYYKIPTEKIVVIHNAVSKNYTQHQRTNFFENKQNVLFLGRLTMQKGPEYFLKAAQKVLTLEPKTNFIIAGDGDMLGQLINDSIEMGISKNIIFTGFLRGPDIDRAFQNANVFVMPSVSEPFGIAALESIKNNTPVIISKQSGANEIIKNTLKVDFWDTDEIANKIISVLRYPELATELSTQAKHELNQLNWTKQAHQIKETYHLATTI